MEFREVRNRFKWTLKKHFTTFVIEVLVFSLVSFFIERALNVGELVTIVGTALAVLFVTALFQSYLVHLPRFVKLSLVYGVILHSRRLSQRYFGTDFREVLDSKSGLYPERSKEFELEGRGSNDHKPWLVPGKDLDRSKYWPHWVFYEVLLEKKAIAFKTKDIGGKRAHQLSITLPRSLRGIYNSDGKAFLKRYYPEKLTTGSQDLGGRDLPPNTSDPDELSKFWGSHNNPPPIRWSSAGALPIIYWEPESADKDPERKWFAFVFRDHPPFGLNCANGGSEYNLELTDLEGLAYREFQEEIICLKGARSLDSALRENSTGVPKLTQVHYDPKLRLLSIDSVEHEKLTSMEFAREHSEKRRQEKDVDIEIEKFASYKLDEEPATMEVDVSFEDLDTTKATGRPQLVQNAIFSLNPAERGIEVIKLYKFAMEPDDFLLWGELGEVRNSPVRNPIILISYRYMLEVFKKDGAGKQVALSDPIDTRPVEGGRVLKSVPSGEFHIFTQDLGLRRKRMRTLELNLRGFKRVCTWESAADRDSRALCSYLYRRLQRTRFNVEPKAKRSKVTVEKLKWITSSKSSKVIVKENTLEITDGVKSFTITRFESAKDYQSAVVEIEGEYPLTFYVKEEKGKHVLYYNSEWDDHATWMRQYGRVFELVLEAQKRNKSLDYDSMIPEIEKLGKESKDRWPFTFCPVTWKTLDRYVNDRSEVSSSGSL